jgi:hypothetical protein
LGLEFTDPGFGYPLDYKRKQYPNAEWISQTIKVMQHNIKEIQYIDYQ